MMFYKKISLMIVLALIAGCTPLAQADLDTAPVNIPRQTSAPLSPAVAEKVAVLRNLPVREFIDQSYIQLMLRDPDLVLAAEGVGAYGLTNDHFTDISDAYIRETQSLESAILDQLHTYDRAGMTREQQIHYDVYEWYLDQSVQGHRFMYYNYLVNSDSTYSLDGYVIYLMTSFEIKDRKSAEVYISHLSEFDTWMDQLLEGLKLSEQAGVIPSKYMIERSLFQVGRGYSDDVHAELSNVDENVLYTSFRDKLGGVKNLTNEEKQTLLDDSRARVEQIVIPAMLKLQDYLTYLLPIAPEEAGFFHVPDGGDYYAYKLRQTTTTDMSPAEIHQLGLDEVKRLQAEMREFAHAELDYPRDSSMYELNQKLSEVPNIPPYELPRYYQSLFDKMEQKRSSYFNLFPKREVILRLDTNGDATDYHSPFDIPGPVFFELPLTGSRAWLPVYFYHEYYPGHTLSDFLSHELDMPLPIIKNETLFPGYVEGWATYTEQLTREMGLYDDYPLAKLRSLQLTLTHAAKAVAETGIHAKGWTLEEAATYMSTATGQPTPPGAILHLVVFPGYRCSYLVGYVKILEFRQRAQDRLGDKFDIRKFHDTILKYGQMPLSVMERVVDDWIEEKMKQ
jgi:uncharacterized protein (DUF885 family)